MKFVTTAIASAMIIPFCPPKARPIIIRSRVKAVNRIAVLNVFPISLLPVFLDVLLESRIQAGQAANRHFRQTLDFLSLAFHSSLQGLVQSSFVGFILLRGNLALLPLDLQLE